MKSPYIVSGFYTPDYAQWVRPLQQSLDKHGQPHDFMPVEKTSQSWEGTVLEKPWHMLNVMDGHPGKTIVWLDVDCTAHGDLSPLSDLPGDIGLRYYLKARNGRALIMRVQANTIVIKPTLGARRFVEAWYSRCLLAPHGEDDEATLVQTIIGTPGVALTQLDLKWVSGLTNGRRATDPIIVHDWASRGTRKVHKFARFLHRHLGTTALGGTQ